MKLKKLKQERKNLIHDMATQSPFVESEAIKKLEKLKEIDNQIEKKKSKPAKDWLDGFNNFLNLPSLPKEYNFDGRVYCNIPELITENYIDLEIKEGHPIKLNGKTYEFDSVLSVGENRVKIRVKETS